MSDRTPSSGDLDLHADWSLPEHPFSQQVKEELHCILDISKGNFLEKLLKHDVITRRKYDEVRRIANMTKRRTKIIQLMYDNKDHNFRLRIAAVLRDPEISASHVAEYIEHDGVRPPGQTNWPFFTEDKSTINELQDKLVSKLMDATSLNTLLGSMETRNLLNQNQVKYITTEKPSDQVPALMEIVVCFSITQLDQFADCLGEIQPELAKPLKQIVIELYRPADGP